MGIITFTLYFRFIVELEWVSEISRFKKLLIQVIKDNLLQLILFQMN